MNDLVERTDLRMKIGDQRPQVPFLNRDALILNDLEVAGQGAIPELVGADLVEHRAHRITKGSGIGASEVRSQTVLVRV